MDTDVHIVKDSAETIYINHPEASYGIFCFNSTGDLFLNSDWGFFGFAWRSYGQNFKEFLSSLNAEYVIGKFEYNLNMTNRFTQKRIQLKGRQLECLTLLIDEFIRALKEKQTP